MGKGAAGLGEGEGRRRRGWRREQRERDGEQCVLRTESKTRQGAGVPAEGDGNGARTALEAERCGGQWGMGGKEERSRDPGPGSSPRPGAVGTGWELSTGVGVGSERPSRSGHLLPANPPVAVNHELQTDEDAQPTGPESTWSRGREHVKRFP